MSARFAHPVGALPDPNEGLFDCSCKTPISSVQLNQQLRSWADDNSRRFSKSSFLYRCKSAGPITGPLWKTLPMARNSTPARLRVRSPRPRCLSFRPNPGAPSARIEPTMSDLATKTCVPCRGGVPPLKGEQLGSLQEHVDGWNVIEEHHITKAFTFPDFRGAFTFRKPRRRACGRAGAPPRPIPCLGKSRDHHLDAQNQRPDGERFHPGRQDRLALQALNFTVLKRSGRRFDVNAAPALLSS